MKLSKIKIIIIIYVLVIIVAIVLSIFFSQQNNSEGINETIIDYNGESIVVRQDPDADHYLTTSGRYFVRSEFGTDGWLEVFPFPTNPDEQTFEEITDDYGKTIEVYFDRIANYYVDRDGNFYLLKNGQWVMARF